MLVTSICSAIWSFNIIELEFKKITLGYPGITCNGYRARLRDLIYNRKRVSFTIMSGAELVDCIEYTYVRIRLCEGYSHGLNESIRPSEPSSTSTQRTRLLER